MVNPGNGIKRDSLDFIIRGKILTGYPQTQGQFLFFTSLIIETQKVKAIIVYKSQKIKAIMRSKSQKIKAMLPNLLMALYL